MGNLEDAFRDAAGEVAQIKAQPSNRYWWLYGTIKAKNENGTLDVAIDGVTIQQVKATVSCMTASVGDRAIVLKAGPLMTCVDVIATSDKVVTPAGSIEGTISADNLPVGSASQRGILQVGNGLSVADGTLSVDSARLLWSGKTQSGVTLSESCANFKAIVVAIGGGDDVVEASTFVWAPNGKTFDAGIAMILLDGSWRSLRMRFTANGKNLSVIYNAGQTSSGVDANAYLMYVIGIV